MPLATPVVLLLEETLKAELFPPDSKLIGTEHANTQCLWELSFTRAFLLDSKLVKQATPYFMDDRKVLGATTLTRIEVKVVNGEP